MRFPRTRGDRPPQSVVRPIRTQVPPHARDRPLPHAPDVGVIGVPPHARG